MPIIIGTTPTITFTFSEILTEDIEKAYLTISQKCSTVIKRDISTAVSTENSLSWKLTQEETFRLHVGDEAILLCDWKLNDGTRGRSTQKTEKVVRTGVNEVI